jgi:hypothetical protein
MSEHYNIFFTLSEHLKKRLEHTQVVFVQVAEYIYKAYYLGDKLHFEIYNADTQKTIFHTTQAPYYYIDTTSFDDTNVILSFLTLLNARNQFNSTIIINGL